MPVDLEVDFCVVERIQIHDEAVCCGVQDVSGVADDDISPVVAMHNPSIAIAIISAGDDRTGHRTAERDVGNLSWSGGGQAAHIENVDVAVVGIHHP